MKFEETIKNIKKLGGKFLTLYTLLVLGLLLASCIPTSEPTQEAGPYGTTGVVLTLEPVKNTYYTVGNSIPFSFLLRIQNKGYHTLDSTDLSFTLTGFDQSIITGIPKTKQELQIVDEIIYGKRTFNSEGSTTLFPIEATSSFDDVGVDFEYDANFLLRYCYKYETLATANVCVNTNTDMYDRGCIPETVLFSGGQGAPIEFISVTPLREGDGYSFNITLKNSGNGAVFPINTDLESCKKLNALSEDYGHFSIKAYFSENEEAECLPSEPNIGQGIASVRCKFEGVSGQYQRLLNLKAEYVYADSSNLPLVFRYFK